MVPSSGHGSLEQTNIVAALLISPPTGPIFAEDITEPFVIEDGHIAVPQGPGFGVTPRLEVLERFTVGSDLM